VSGVTYDTGALLAAEANRRDVWALHARALERGILPVVPSPVLGQGWRGGPQVALSRLLRGCRVEDLTEDRARSVGVACARSRTSDIVDASVVIGALARKDLVVTSDPDDLTKIAESLARRISLYRV
jgi:hypothetical protein